MFWTLDLNGKRYIVKPFNGQAQGGMRYLYWAGPEKDFAQKPLALSFISPPQPSATSSTMRDGPLPGKPGFASVNRKRSIPSDGLESSESSASSDTSDTSDSEVEERNTRRPDLAQRENDAGPQELFQQIDDSTSDRGDHRSGEMNTLKQPAAFQGGPAKRRKTEVSSYEMNQLYRVSPPTRRRSDVHIAIREQQPEPAQPTTSSSTKPVNESEEKRKQSAIARIEKDLGRKFDQIFTPWAGEDQSVSRNTLLMIYKVIGLMEDSSPQRKARSLNKAVNGGDGKRQDSGGTKPKKPFFMALEATLKANNAVTINGGRRSTPSSPSGSNRQQLDQRTFQRIEAAPAVSGQAPGLTPRSIPLENNRQRLVDDLDFNFLPLLGLSEHKQMRTTLYVRVATSPEYIPLKMSECVTPQAFYTKVLSAWDIREESVAKITATFTWMAPEDKMRTMIMNSKIQGCFEHLLEQIDEAPGWEEGGKWKGKCFLDIDIMLKE